MGVVKGQVLFGKFGEIYIRQKAGENIELGELLVADNILLQVYELKYGSQISPQNIELISGIMLEEDSNLELMDKDLRNYNIAVAKPLVSLGSSKLCKNLPNFFSDVREITKEDLKFLVKPENSLFVGKLRSGSKELDVDIFLPGNDVLSHHILIAATTGRGKSNLVKIILYDLVDKNYCGMLVLDPHNEYYGVVGHGLKDHPNKENVAYYSKDPMPGTRTLKINIQDIKPWHFNGALNLTDAQESAMLGYYKKFKQDWIRFLLKGAELNDFNEVTLNVLRRKVAGILDIGEGEDIYSKGVFSLEAGSTTISDIVNELEKGRVVIIDTSSFSGNVEILIGSIIANEILNRYKKYSMSGTLKNMPVVNIVLEEAPRVLGKEVLERGSNVFSTIAREGRKFKVGLTAITQLPSLIPRDILANMNTKIILGIEMKPERNAIIESSAQDLSQDDRNIASLDKGEALVTSNFTKLAIPIKIPLFEPRKKTQGATKVFSGIYG